MASILKKRASAPGSGAGTSDVTVAMRHRSIHEGATAMKDVLLRATLLWELDETVHEDTEDEEEDGEGDEEDDDEGEGKGKGDGGEEHDAGFTRRQDYYGSKRRRPSASSDGTPSLSSNSGEHRHGHASVRFGAEVEANEMRRTLRRPAAVFNDETVVLVRNATVPRNIIVRTIQRTGLFVMVAPATGKHAAIVHTIGMTQVGHAEMFMRCTNAETDAAVHVMNRVGQVCMLGHAHVALDTDAADGRCVVKVDAGYVKGAKADAHWKLFPLCGEALDDANNRIMIQAAMYYDRGVAIAELVRHTEGHPTRAPAEDERLGSTEGERLGSSAPTKGERQGSSAPTKGERQGSSAPPPRSTTTTNIAPPSFSSSTSTSTSSSSSSPSSSSTTASSPSSSLSSSSSAAEAGAAVVGVSTTACTSCGSPTNVRICSRCCPLGRGALFSFGHRSKKRGCGGKAKKEKPTKFRRGKDKGKRKQPKGKLAGVVGVSPEDYALFRRILSSSSKVFSSEAIARHAACTTLPGFDALEALEDAPSADNTVHGNSSSTLPCRARRQAAADAMPGTSSLCTSPVDVDADAPQAGGRGGAGRHVGLDQGFCAEAGGRRDSLATSPLDVDAFCSFEHEFDRRQSVTSMC